MMDQMAAPAREQLINVRNGLLRLHKSLLDSEKAAYERDVEPITTTGQFLGLVMNDPWFAWLRDLSQFIVLIDETMDDDAGVTDADAARLLTQARELIAPSEEGQGFRRRYFEAMQRDPAAVLAHRDMMKIFGTLS